VVLERSQRHVPAAHVDSIDDLPRYVCVPRNHSNSKSMCFGVDQEISKADIGPARTRVAAE
jgi:hypothetical protein